MCLLHIQNQCAKTEYFAIQKDVPILQRIGQVIAVRIIMEASLSSDHRVASSPLNFFSIQDKARSHELPGKSRDAVRLFSVVKTTVVVHPKDGSYGIFNFSTLTSRQIDGHLTSQNF